MITTDTKNELGITVAKDLRTVMQGKVAIAGEASYHGPLCLSGDESTRELTRKFLSFNRSRLSMKFEGNTFG